ncbi:bifunctional Ribonuclease Z-Hydroxyacylglutathione hydrolase-like/Metallo-beta-lactamase [Babesia duncani]|uniref:Bifunctional Ribonuclease Z-Hydroxyacylglutathione hydrolase-like/Metallo-beta-lactamase n=1 Tax=Babesia duncani TaxID=323732 RepID=A0AAD9UPV0_9APIC|nr:bifunctional Ribonuclease Z-Hydroxyacylglutathione hydrolase-like/Metallo-beta-lactamase [Babesia duncani]
MSSLKITVLGAGQDVGRSCIVATFPSRRIMLDCGAHCGFLDHRRYPALQLLGNVKDYDAHVAILSSRQGEQDACSSDQDEDLDPFMQNAAEKDASKRSKAREERFLMACKKQAMKKTLENVTSTVDCAIMSHFHMDHVGALPFYTEHIGYRGPIYMTFPTRGLSPILLRDCAQVSANRAKGQDPSRNVSILLNRNVKQAPISEEQLQELDPWSFTIDNVAKSFTRAIPMQLRATHNVSRVNITPYYAGHVLGASVVHVECDGLSLVYTGLLDFAQQCGSRGL